MGHQQPIEIFMPPNILKAKVGGHAGPDLGAIRRAEAAVRELRCEFRGWAAEELKKLGAARDRYAKADNAAGRAALNRAAHDLKGHAASFDFPFVARIAASLARLLTETRQNAPLPPGLVDAHVDAAQVIFRENIADGNNEITRLLCTELNARVTEALGRSG
jgi:chemotaxis protein histidine kinase CheA